MSIKKHQRFVQRELDAAEIAGEVDPPVVEQLVTPNALRQRRFREKQKALRNAQNVTTEALPNAPDDSDENAGGVDE